MGCASLEKPLLKSKFSSFIFHLSFLIYHSPCLTLIIFWVNDEGPSIISLCHLLGVDMIIGRAVFLSLYHPYRVEIRPFFR